MNRPLEPWSFPGVPPARVCNRARLSLLLGVASTTVDGWTRAGCPVLREPSAERSAPAAARPRLYDLAAVVAWLLRRARTQAPGAPIGRLTEALTSWTEADWRRAIGQRPEA